VPAKIEGEGPYAAVVQHADHALFAREFQTLRDAIIE